jgi:molybdenum-dependent DNA-binding transcriptional regulator ModE
MIDWDDVRYFLAVAREGSVRAAAEGLGVYHSTVLRRIAQLEERLGAQMFEKLPSGYRLTASGEEVLELANQMEASSHQLETRVFGRDQSVRGLLRVTLAPTLATHLLMPDFADFARLHPDIEMEILSSGELANLTNREADVAIRVVYDRKTLFGRLETPLLRRTPRKIDQPISIVFETEQIADRRNSPLNSRARISDGSGIRFFVVSGKIFLDGSMRYDASEQSSGNRGRRALSGSFPRGANC